MLPQPMISRIVTSAADGATTEPRIRINRPAVENAGCKVFKTAGSAKKFLSVHAAVHNIFTVQRHLTSARTHRAFRASAMSMWRAAVAVA
jgi:hypothetical protein